MFHKFFLITDLNNMVLDLFLQATGLSPCRSGKATESRKMHQREARISCCASSTSGHRSKESVKPMELVQRCIGELMEQTVDCK